MPVNIPVTLTCSQATTVKHIDAPAKHLATSEATAAVTVHHPNKRLHVSEAAAATTVRTTGRHQKIIEPTALVSIHTPGRHLRISEATSLSMSSAKNVVLLIAVEHAVLTEHPTIHKPLKTTQATTAVRHTGHGKVFNITQATVAAMSGHGMHSRKFTITQSTTPSVDHPSVHRTLLVPGATALVQHTHVNRLPFHISETTSAILDSSSGRVHRLAVNQATAIHVHSNTASHHRLTEATVPKHRSGPHKTYKLVEHTTIKERALPIKVLRASETTTAKHTDHVSAHLRVTEATTVKRIAVPHSVRRTTEATTMHISKHPTIVPLILEHTHLTKHSLTHHHPFVISEATTVRRTTDLNKVSVLHEATTLHMGPKRLVIHVPVHVTTAVVVHAPQLTRNTVPLMGYVYKPTDVVGSQVEVLTDLWDYYFILSTDAVPKLYWGPSDHSRNVPNDSYNYWKTK